MGKWGAELEIKTAVFVPHVITRGFEDANPNDLIDYVLLLDEGMNEYEARQTLSELSDRYVGKEYRCWLLE